MAFAWQPQHFATLDLFRQYLKGQQRPAWVKGNTIHHTWKPTAATWHGMATMESLGAFYRDVQGWPAGPHLFLCLGAPSPAHDGIFIGTPLDTVGVHAGTCNTTRWGIEIVGNFDVFGWPPYLADLVYGVNQVLATFGGFAPETVNGHRECLPNKTCPGKAIDMDAVRAEAKRRAEPDWPALWGSHFPYWPNFGIPTRWRQEHANRSLGKAMTGEMSMADGRVVQCFEQGGIWYRTGETGVWR